MSAIIEQLNQEHANMSRILDLLEHEIEAFGRGEVADFHLVQEIMDYCLDYPEACHHPKEDAIYAVMIDRRPNLADEIADLSGAHAKLGRQTQGAHGTVERIVATRPWRGISSSTYSAHSSTATACTSNWRKRIFSRRPRVFSTMPTGPASLKPWRIGPILY